MSEEREKKREKPFRSCHGLRIAVTCHPQIRPSPKHVRLGLLLFIYPGPPLDPFTRFAVTSPFVPCTLLTVYPPPSSSPRPPFFSCRVRSGIDRCHRGTNTPGRTCQRVLMSFVIVINTLIRTVAKTAHAFVTACAILNIMRVT